MSTAHHVDQISYKGASSGCSEPSSRAVQVTSGSRNLHNVLVACGARRELSARPQIQPATRSARRTGPGRRPGRPRGRGASPGCGGPSPAARSAPHAHGLPPTPPHASPSRAIPSARPHLRTHVIGMQNVAADLRAPRVGQLLRVRFRTRLITVYRMHPPGRHCLVITGAPPSRRKCPQAARRTAAGTAVQRAWPAASSWPCRGCGAASDRSGTGVQANAAQSPTSSVLSVPNSRRVRQWTVIAHTPAR